MQKESEKEMRELPKNPNTRQPYSDVYQELSDTIGSVVEFLGVSRDDLSHGDKESLDKYMRQLDQASLRVQAVLDPDALTDVEWTQAQISTWDIK